MHKVFFSPICAEDWNKKKCDAGEIPMHAYLVFCTLKKVLFSDERLNQPHPTPYLNPWDSFQFNLQLVVGAWKTNKSWHSDFIAAYQSTSTHTSFSQQLWTSRIFLRKKRVATQKSWITRCKTIKVCMRHRSGGLLCVCPRVVLCATPGTVWVLKYALAMRVRWYHTHHLSTQLCIFSQNLKGKSAPLFATCLFHCPWCHALWGSTRDCRF